MKNLIHVWKSRVRAAGIGRTERKEMSGGRGCERRRMGGRGEAEREKQ